MSDELFEVVSRAIKHHYATCRRAHGDNDGWHECEARAVVAALKKAGVP